MKTKILLSALLFSFAFANVSLGQGCMEGDSDEGVSVIGFIQPTYDYFLMDEDDFGNTKTDHPNSFYFKRARLGVAGSIPYDVSYYVMAEFSPLAHEGSAYILDAFVTYAPFGNYAKISMGQFKSPMGLELNTPCHSLHTIRRSTAVNQLAGPFRDMGAMLLLSTDTLFGKKDLVTARFAVLNGTGLNTWDDNKFKDIAARLVISPTDWLSVGGSFRTGKQGMKINGIKQSKSTRVGGDIEIEYKNFLLQGEYIMAEDEGAEPTSGGGCGGKSTGSINEDEGGEWSRDGYFVQLMYMTPWYLHPVIKYETYNPDGLDYSFLYQDQDFGQSSFTFGINYFINEWTRVQLNYMYNAEETGEYNNDAISIQLQAKF